MLLELNNVQGGYGNRQIIKGISCQAEAGEILCLLGPNGCGKTTLFRLILGTLPLTGGSIKIDGQDISSLSPAALARLVAYIPQHHTPVFSFTVLDVVLMGRAAHFSAMERPKAKDRKAAFEALEKVNAAHLANEKYTALSGGQRQLVLIARAICQSARIMVMDEPSANLDYANQRQLLSVSQELAAGGYGVIMSTHSPEHPAAIGHRVLMIREGRAVAWGSPQEIITPENLERVYGVPMDVAVVVDRYGTRRTLCLPVHNPLEASVLNV